MYANILHTQIHEIMHAKDHAKVNTLTHALDECMQIMFQVQTFMLSAYTAEQIHTLQCVVFMYLRV